MSDKIDRLVYEAHFSELAAKIWVKSDGKCVYCGEDLVMTSLGYSCSNKAKNIIANEGIRTEIIERIQRHIADQIGKRHAEWWTARQILLAPEIK